MAAFLRFFWIKKLLITMLVFFLPIEQDTQLYNAAGCHDYRAIATS
jgi:hypothetical protein